MKWHRHRQGFTLVELLVVITILGILVGLLVPVIWSAVRTGNDARVSGEINSMGQALASFQSKYGALPPSRIILKEDGAYGANVPSDPTGYFGIQGTSDSSGAMSYAENYQPIGDFGWQQAYPDADLTYTALAQRSITWLRKLFPRIQLTTGATPVGEYDFNGNGVIDTAPILLEGHECLVFFLGGIPNQQGGVSGVYTLQGMSGFSNRPENPFIPETDPLTGVTESNRTPPFHDFQPSRLIDDDFDGIPGYVDTLGVASDARYFVYFSSYGGSGYDPNDTNFDDLTLNAAVAARPFRLSFAVGGATDPRLTISPIPNPYTSGPAVPPGASPANFINNESYQIISAGRDRDYGAGGQYDASGTGTRLIGDAAIPEANRTVERDNLTNFNNGQLE